MADEGKFGIEVNVDTSKATKNLKDLNKEAEKTNKTLNQEHTIDIETDAAEAKLDEINTATKNIGSTLDNMSKKVNSAFNVGKLALWYEGLKKVGQVAYEATKYVIDAAQQMTSIGNTAQGLSISTNTLKAWETTFKSMGFDAKEADAALGSIQDRLTGQLLNPSIQVASAFSMMGINLRKANGELRNSDDVLGEIASKLKNFKPEYAIAIGAQLGLNRDQVTQMRNNPNFAKTLAEQKANPVITTQGEQAARGVTEQTAKLGAEMDKLQNQAFLPLNVILTKDVVPNLTKIADSLSIMTGGAVKDIATFATHPTESLKKVMSPGTMGDVMASGGIQSLIAAGKRQGMSQKQIDTMLQIARAEDATFSNKPSNIPDSSAGGFFQMIDKTWRDLGMKGSKYDTNSQVTAYNKLFKEFEGVANKNNIEPNAMQYRAFHNLGQGNYLKAVSMLRQNPRLTYGDVYNSVDPTGAMASSNRGLTKQQFPALGIDNKMSSPNLQNNVTPMAAQSTNVTNNMISQDKTSNISSSTTIGSVNVSANNPEQFARELQNSGGYLDKILNMTGQLA